MWSGSHGFKICTTWPQGYNPKMQTIRAHRQGPCLILCLSPPCPTATSQKRVTDGMNMGGASCLRSVVLLWNMLSLCTPVKVPFKLHGPCQVSPPLMPCCKLKSLSGLPGVLPSPVSVLLCPVPSCSFAHADMQRMT